MDLNEVRKKIDELDVELLRLMDKRMEMSLRTKRFKGEVTDGKREGQVLDAIGKKARGLVSAEFGGKILSELIAQGKELQKKELVLVGFQGEHGAYSEIAAKRLENSVPIPCLEFAEVFEAVKKGELDFGVVPVENSLAGPVAQVNELLMESGLHVVGEITVPVHHCLLAPPDVDYREIRVVYSHPQALAQCAGFIARNKLEAKPYYDTAGAAKMVAEEKPRGAAAIASSLCAQLYSLEIIKENIEDHSSNTTRFLVVSRERGKENGSKCTLAFATAHKSGALFSILKIFADAKINLTRILSLPMKNGGGEYGFIIDFDGCDGDVKVKDALEKTQKESGMFRFLGCYKEL